MKRILVFGMSPILGGVETYIYNIAKNIDKKKYIFDYLIVGTEHSVFEEELKKINPESKFFYAPNIKRHYILGNKLLREFYDKCRYDCIYMNTCTAARVLYCEYSIKKYKTSLIVHSHSGNAHSTINKFSNKLFRSKITRLSKVHLACSEVAYEWMFNDKLNKKNIIPNGVDLERFCYSNEWRYDIRSQLDFSDDDIVIGNVGRLSQQKNQLYFIELAKKLDNKYKILIIGDGELKEKIQSKIREEKLENRFRVLSAKNDLERYYSAMDIFAMPSIFEGLPIVGIEAQAEGLPCVFSINISPQTALSDKCTFVNLDNIGEWVSTIKKCSIEKYDGSQLVKDRGFDNMRPVKMIENILDLV